MCGVQWAKIRDSFQLIFKDFKTSDNLNLHTLTHISLSLQICVITNCINKKRKVKEMIV